MRRGACPFISVSQAEELENPIHSDKFDMGIILGEWGSLGIINEQTLQVTVRTMPEIVSRCSVFQQEKKDVSLILCMPNKYIIGPDR